MADSKTVLVVDDSRMTGMMINRIITSHYPDWEVLEAASGEQALQLTDGRSVDIITLDYNMPGMDGVELGTRLRERFPGAFISLVTANIQSATRDKAKAAQLHFVPKPITEDRILSNIHAALI